MIIGIQNTLVLTHVDVFFPANVDVYLQYVSQIAGMDMMFGEEITKEIFTSFSNEDPLNDRWERYQVSSMVFLLCIGSILLPILALTLIYHGIIRLIHFIAKKNYKSNTCRIIGSKLYR